jgi:hypothetical protein
MPAMALRVIRSPAEKCPESGLERTLHGHRWIRRDCLQPLMELPGLNRDRRQELAAQDLARVHGRQTTAGRDIRKVHLPMVDVVTLYAHGLAP